MNAHTTQDDDEAAGFEEPVEYRRMSTRELLNLAEKGDDAAEDELERRRNLLRH